MRKMVSFLLLLIFLGGSTGNVFAKSVSYKNGQQVTLTGYYDIANMSGEGCGGGPGGAPNFWYFFRNDQKYSKYVALIGDTVCTAPTMGGFMLNPLENKFPYDYYNGIDVISDKSGHNFTFQTKEGVFVLQPSKKLYENLSKKYSIDDRHYSVGKNFNGWQGMEAEQILNSEYDNRVTIHDTKLPKVTISGTYIHVTPNYSVSEKIDPEYYFSLKSSINIIIVDDVTFLDKPIYTAQKITIPQTITYENHTYTQENLQTKITSDFVIQSIQNGQTKGGYDVNSLQKQLDSIALFEKSLQTKDEKLTKTITNFKTLLQDQIELQKSIELNKAVEQLFYGNIDGLE